MAASGLVTHQPFKGIWALGAIILNASKLPFWYLYYATSLTRPHPKWSLKQAVGAKVMRNVIYHFSILKVFTPLILNPTSKEEGLLVTIAPSLKPGVYGGICDDKQIKPETVCGYWYPSPYQPGDKKVVLHFHGGAFVIGDCRPAESGGAASHLTKHIGKTFMANYRLSSNPNGRFPAAIQDAISALHYLLDLGIDCSDIILSGDSAGGNLVLALLRHLALADAPMPFAALLWSPWVDLATTLTPEILYYHRSRKTDYIPADFAIWGANAYCPKDAPVGMDDKWISPAKEPFHSKTPIWVQVCEQEILFDQMMKFAEDMKRIEGNTIGIYIDEIANHDFLLVGKNTGFEKEADNAAKAAGEWLKQL